MDQVEWKTRMHFAMSPKNMRAVTPLETTDRDALIAGLPEALRRPARAMVAASGDAQEAAVNELMLLAEEWTT